MPMQRALSSPKLVASVTLDVSDVTEVVVVEMQVNNVGKLFR